MGSKNEVIFHVFKEVIIPANQLFVNGYFREGWFFSKGIAGQSFNDEINSEIGGIMEFQKRKTIVVQKVFCLVAPDAIILGVYDDVFHDRSEFW